MGVLLALYCFCLRKSQRNAGFPIVEETCILVTELQECFLKIMSSKCFQFYSNFPISLFLCCKVTTFYLFSSQDAHLNYYFLNQTLIIFPSFCNLYIFLWHFVHIHFIIFTTVIQSFIILSFL